MFVGAKSDFGEIPGYFHVFAPKTWNCESYDLSRRQMTSFRATHFFSLGDFGRIGLFGDVLCFQNFRIIDFIFMFVGAKSDFSEILGYFHVFAPKT